MLTVQAHNRRVALMVLAVVAIAAGLAWLDTAHIDRSMHLSLEAGSVALAMAVGLLAITRYRSERSVPALLLGTAFIGTAAFDLLHLVLSHGAIVDRMPSPIEDVSAWSWFAGRMYLALMLIVREVFGRRLDEGPDVAASERASIAISLVLFVAAIFVFLLVPLPSPYLRELPVPRFQELIPGLLVAFVAWRTFRRGNWRSDAAATWILAGIVLEGAVQVAFMPFSGAHQDSWFLAAHVLKLVGYFAFLVALVVDLRSLHEDAAEARSTLEWTNRHLARENERRRRVDMLLDTQRQLLESILDSLSDPVLITDPNGKIERINRAAEVTFGRGLVGMSLERLAGSQSVRYPDGTPVKTEELAMYRGLQGEAVTEMHEVLRRPGRAPIHVTVSGRPVIDRFGKRHGVVAIYHDITEQVESDERIRTYTRELERRNRDLQDFAFIASHDLREPLRKIRAFGERLQVEQKDVLDEAGRDHVDRMVKAAGRMSDLLDGLLEYSRVTTRAHPFEAIDLGEMVEEVLEDLEIRIKATKAQLDVGPLPVIRGDPTQLQQAFQNLIGNALKFTEPGEVPQVSVQGEVVEETARVWVEDQGIGIDPDNADRMFRPFQRLVAREEYEGHGMGLAIVRKIVERHGGAIRAEGAPGRGARFIMEFPLRPLEAPEVAAP